METIHSPEAKAADREARFDTGMEFIMLSFLVAFVVHIRTQVLTGVIEFVSSVNIVDLATGFCVRSIIIATTKAKAKNKASQVNF